MSHFRAAMTSTTGAASSAMTTTDNGALALKSTGSGLLDYFAKALGRVKASRTDESTVYSMLDRAWTESPQDTLRLIAQKRDCRGGAGERLISQVSWKWLMELHPEQVRPNMRNLVEYGRWKDLVDHFCGTSEEDFALGLLAVQIQKDREVLDQVEILAGANPEPSDEVSKQIARLTGSLTLAAKWAPTEGCTFDKAAQKRAVALGEKRYVRPSEKVARALITTKGISRDTLMSAYRKRFLSVNKLPPRKLLCNIIYVV